MEYRKSNLTNYAKVLAKANSYLVNGICMAEENVHSEICERILQGDEELLIEISKRFAKHTQDENAFYSEAGGLQDFKNVINKIIECCEENDWFDKR